MALFIMWVFRLWKKIFWWNRFYFFILGGNNHAIEHSKGLNHPVVVKLGTITPEGNASVHCYSCDEEVNDPNIQKNLANFGIKIDKLIKTEKSIMEMTLELNLNL